jgi:hypothetical protein
MTSPRGLSLTLVLSLLSAGFLAAQQPVRDSQRPPSGTAALSGTLVSDDVTPQAIRRARIELSIGGEMAQSTFTDASGKFAFRMLAAGRYTLAATKPSYVRSAYGAKRPDRPGTPITIADGQAIEGVVLKMARGSVITGTIRDEMGLPAPGVSVRVLQYRMQSGERVLGPAPILAGAIGTTTDDRGVYRIFGLAAGDYVITATPRALGTGDIRQMTPAEIQSVQRALQQQGASTPAAGQPPAGPQPTTVTYAPVFYPNTISAGNAATVTVGAAEERAGVDMSLQLVRTARIEGVVTTSNGVPAQLAQLLMIPSGPAMTGFAMAIPFNRVTPGPDGRFTYTGVAPGQYTISARIAGQGQSGGLDPGPRAPAEGRGRNAIATGTLWATADVSVDGENLAGVTLNMQPGMTVAGRVVIEGANPDGPGDLSRTRISLVPATIGSVTIGIGGSGTQVDASGRFALTDVTPGKYRLSAQLAGPDANRTLKSAIVNGKDVLDFPLEIGPNDKVTDAVLTFTSQTQEVSGSLQDAAGRPAPDFTIVVFSADKALWSASRRIRTTRPGTDGTFTIGGLPAGDYRIAALVDIAPNEANDPALLEQLVPASVPFALHEGEHKVQNIKMAGG